MFIERGSYIYDISGKTGDLTFETIKIIIGGKCDAWFPVIEKNLDDMKLVDDNKKHALTNALNFARQNLRKK